MFTLQGSTESLTVVADSAADLTEPTFHVVYTTVSSGDTTAATDVDGNQGSLTGTSSADLVAAPAGTDERDVANITIHNADTSTRTITVRHTKSATDRILIIAVVEPSGTLTYEHGQGWKLILASGVESTSFSTLHQLTHNEGGTDALKLDDLATPDDNTDLDATITEHGLLPKLSNVVTEFLDGTGAYSVPASGGSVVATQEFRLCGTTADPVLDTSNINTLYFSGMHGRDAGGSITLWDGAEYITLQSAEVSLALSALTSGKPYDVFAFDSGGTLTLELLVWTDDTNRATALDFDQTIGAFKTGDLTRRFVGSIYTTDVDETQDSVTQRLVSNAYNRVRKSFKKRENTGTVSWTYAISTYRSANADANNRVEVMSCLSIDSLEVRIDAHLQTSGTGNISAGVGLGVNSTSVNSADGYQRVRADPVDSDLNGSNLSAIISRPAPLGRNLIYWLEASVGTATYIGGPTTFVASSISGSVMA